MNKQIINFDFDALKEKNEKDDFLRKKVRALTNYANFSEDFEEWALIEWITRFYDHHFIDKESEKFLDHILKKYKIDPLEWGHPTPRSRAALLRNRGKHVQIEMNLPEADKERLRSWGQMSMSSIVFKGKHISMRGKHAS